MGQASQWTTKCNVTETWEAKPKIKQHLIDDLNCNKASNDTKNRTFQALFTKFEQMGKLLVLDLATMKFKIISHGKINSAQEMKKYVILDKFLDPNATGIVFNESLNTRAYVNDRKMPFGSQVIIRNSMKFL